MFWRYLGKNLKLECFNVLFILIKTGTFLNAVTAKQCHGCADKSAFWGRITTNKAFQSMVTASVLRRTIAEGQSALCDRKLCCQGQFVLALCCTLCPQLCGLLTPCCLPAKPVPDHCCYHWKWSISLKPKGSLGFKLQQSRRKAGNQCCQWEGTNWGIKLSPRLRWGARPVCPLVNIIFLFRNKESMYVCNQLLIIHITSILCNVQKCKLKFLSYA